MVTIRDVARHAGVSVATVSRVINKTGAVSDDLSQRVRQAIAVLGFEPDFLARTWRTRVTHTIAAVLSDNTSPHHSIALREAGVIALANDYSLILCTTYSSIETERRYLRMLRNRHVDGVLLNSVGDCYDAVRSLTERGIPVVMLNRPLAGYGPMVDAVVTDSYRGSYDLVDHLLGLGRRRILMIHSVMHAFHTAERIRGYRDALQAHSVAFDPALVRCVDAVRPDAQRLMRELLAVQPEPDALYAAGYNCGLVAVAALREQSRRVPDDIAFAMYDQVAWGEYVEPSLTLVQNPAEEMGRTAMGLLLARLADHTRPAQEIRLQPTLIVRRSCGWSGPIQCAMTPAMARKELSVA
jgi:LacI family transcriptional regulator